VRAGSCDVVVVGVGQAGSAAGYYLRWRTLVTYKELGLVIGMTGVALSGW